MRRIHKFEEINHMVSVAPDFFPPDQETLDKCHVFLMDGFCYVRIKPVVGHEEIGEAMILSDAHKKGCLIASSLPKFLRMIKESGFKRIAVFFRNKRLKDIFLRKKLLQVWGQGWFLMKEDYHGE
jgi:hypothetical protein